MAKGGRITCYLPHYDGKCSGNHCPEAPEGAGFTTMARATPDLIIGLITLVRGCDYRNCPCLVKPPAGRRCPLAPARPGR